MQPQNNDSEELAARLAELDASSPPLSDDTTVASLKAELDTLASHLQSAPAKGAFENEPALGRVTAIVQALGHPPEDSSDQTVYTIGSSGPPVTARDAPLGLFGVYELLAKIGEGGMGAVYKARHLKLDKIVAIKVLPADRMKDKQAVARFEREMRAVGKLEHPNIVRAMDAGEVGGMHYLVMEYVQGIDLSKLVHERGPLDAADACELIRQAAIGLDEAHDHGMVHRDIKPSNLMLCLVGKRKPPVVKILDMGLALLTEAQSPDAQGLTSTGQMMGTLDYMAPEQGGDSKNVDIRADIYALGASLYKLLCGETIYYGEQYQTLMQKMTGLATHPAPPIQDRRPGIAPELAAVLHRMLAKDPNQRYATPEEVAQVLAPFCVGANLAGLLTSVGFEVAAAKETVIAEPNHSQSGPDSRPTITAPPVASVAVPRVVPTPAAGRARPPWSPVVIAGGIFGGLAALMAVIVFFLQTPHGTLRVEIDDPLIEVTVKGTDIVLKQSDNEEIRLTPGDRKLIVKRGDFTFETDNFKLKKDETTVIKVEIVPGDVQLNPGVLHVHQGETLIGRQDLAAPQVPAPAKGKNRQLSLSGERWVEIPSLTISLRDDLTIEAYLTRRKEALSMSEHVGEDYGAWIGINDECWTGYVMHTVMTSDQRAVVGERVHVALVCTRDQSRLYVNGKLAQTQNGERPLRPDIPRRLFKIGDANLQADFDEVRVSTVARYDRDFAPAGRFERDEATLALYHCDDGSEEMLLDSSGNGHHGQFAGMDAPLTFAPEGNDAESVAQWLLVHKKLAGIRVVVDGKIRELNANLMITAPTPRFKVLELNFHKTQHGGNLLAEDVPKLAVFTDLEFLELTGQPVTDAGFATLTPLRELQRLYISGTNLSPAAVETIRSFTKLFHLRGPCDEEWLRRLAGMPSLHILELSGSPITKEAMGGFAQYPNLQTLTLSDIDPATPAAWEPLKQCQKLSILDVSGDSIDDSFAEIFIEMKGLISLGLANTKLTEASAQKIAAALPKCRIAWKGGVIEPLAARGVIVPSAAPAP